MKPISFVLPDASEIVIRGVEAGDRHYLAEGLRRLSAQSTFYRFNSHLARLSPTQLDYLTLVDQSDHAAIGVLRPCADEPIAIGRYIRCTEDRTRAEVALTVLDAYQRKGVGILLLTGLYQIATEQGITHFTMQIHSVREGLIRKMVQSGALLQQQRGGISAFEISLTDLRSGIVHEGKNLGEALHRFDVNWAGVSPVAQS